MDTAEHVRVVLVECRRRKMDFGEAWMAALLSLPRPRRADAARDRAEWLEALAWARPFYARAYAGRPFGDQPMLEDASTIVDVVAA